MAPHQQRVVDEQVELDDKRTKLRDFIESSPIYAELPLAERDRLDRQYLVMTEYSSILGHRIAAFTA